MRGDRLASGARSATFAQGGFEGISVPEIKTVFAECKGCDFVAYSATEFSNHVRECPINPIPWPVRIMPDENYVSNKVVRGL